MSIPKVSIIMPTYRRKHLIGRAIRSALAQTESNWELIIVDDCPEDPAEAEVKKFAEPRIRYLRHDRNKGGAAARNTAMAVSIGEYIGFLDDDDEWLPEKIATQLDAFTRAPADVGFSFSGAYIVSEKGEISTHVPSGARDYFNTLVQNSNLFLGLTVMVRRTVYLDVGGWDETQPSHQEVEWMFRIARKYHGVGIDLPLVRAYSGNVHEHIGSNPAKRIAGRELLLTKYDDVFRARPSAYVKHHFLLAIWYRDTGDLAKAKEEIRKTLAVRWGLRRALHLALLSVAGGRLYRLVKRPG